jgi:RNA polymerase sigma-70 factor (ECF subfamily)
LNDLLRASEPALQRLAARVCLAADAEDAVQEVLWRASSRIGALRVAAAFLGWAQRMVLYECLRLKRRVERLVFASVEIPQAEVVPSPEVMRAFAQLNLEARDILVHREILGHSAAEAAALLGISVESSKSRLRRARAQLRAVLTSERD